MAASELNQYLEESATQNLKTQEQRTVQQTSHSAFVDNLLSSLDKKICYSILNNILTKIMDLFETANDLQAAILNS